MTASTINMMSWNVKSGGFDSYALTQAPPERGDDIRSFIERQHVAFGIDTVGISDAYRWDEVYGGDTGIAEHLGYSQARFVRLNDDRLNRDNSAGIGIAFATDQTIEQTNELDLETRQGLGVILGIGRYGLQVANVYLDDLRESIRLRQVRALMSALEKGVPTLIVGDMNTLRPDMRGVRPKVRAGDAFVRVLAHVLPRRTAIGLAIAEMNQRKVVPLMQSSGFIDADRRQKRPTALASAPMFGIDYAFHTKDIQVEGVRVLPTSGESDHRPLVFSARIPADSEDLDRPALPSQ